MPVSIVPLISLTFKVSPSGVPATFQLLLLANRTLIGRCWLRCWFHGRGSVCVSWTTSSRSHGCVKTYSWTQSGSTYCELLQVLSDLPFKWKKRKKNVYLMTNNPHWQTGTYVIIYTWLLTLAFGTDWLRSFSWFLATIFFLFLSCLF